MNLLFSKNVPESDVRTVKNCGLKISADKELNVRSCLSRYVSKSIRILDHCLALVVTTAMSVFPALVILWLNSVARIESRIYITIGMTRGLGSFLRLFVKANVEEILAVTIR
jgi:hypothetical protein